MEYLKQYSLSRLVGTVSRLDRYEKVGLVEMKHTHGIFSSGVTRANFIKSGKTPSERDLLTIRVIAGARTSAYVFRR